MFELLADASEPQSTSAIEILITSALLIIGIVAFGFVLWHVKKTYDPRGNDFDIDGSMSMDEIQTMYNKGLLSETEFKELRKNLLLVDKSEKNTEETSLNSIIKSELEKINTPNADGMKPEKDTEDCVESNTEDVESSDEDVENNEENINKNDTNE